MTFAAQNLNLDLNVYYCDKSALKQRKYLDLIIEDQKEKPDYIVAVNENLMGTEVLEKVKGSGIKLLFILNDLNASQKLKYGKPRQEISEWLGSLTPDAENAGYSMAKSLFESGKAKFSTPTKIFAILGDRSTPSSVARNNGLIRATKRFFPNTRRDYPFAKWNKRKSYRIMTRYIQTHQDNAPKLYWAANDDIAIGIIAALSKVGRIGGTDYFIAGLNWSDEGLKRVLDGEMLLTHGGHFFAGAWSMVLLNDTINGIDFASESTDIIFPMSEINQHNVKNYLEQFPTSDYWKNINFRSFSKFYQPDIQKYDFSLSNILLSTIKK